MDREEEPGGAFGLTLRDLCDVVQVLLYEQVERRVLAEQQVAAVFIAARVPGVTLPSAHEARGQLDEALTAPTVTTPAADPQRQQILEALGLA